MNSVQSGNVPVISTELEHIAEINVEAANIPKLSSKPKQTSVPKKRVNTNPSNKNNVKVSAAEIKRISLDLQRAHKRAERERERLRKENERQELIRKRKEEQDRLNEERQLKKERLEKEKEARRLQREEERLQKEKEKEDERLKKEEEKRKRDEERITKELERQKDEEERIRKTEKQRAILMGFLVRSEDKEEPVVKEEVKKGPFMQFQLMKNQRMAPVCRVPESLRAAKRSNIESLQQSWLSDSTTTDIFRLGLRKFGQPNYLHELRTGQIKCLSSSSTWPVEMPDVLLSGDGAKTRCSATLRYGHGDRGDGGTVWTKAKLLQFVENYRPAYYGTWRRQSVAITGRRPFAKDLLQLDYEVDSDDEWEEEEPGESITQSEGEEEEDIADDDDDEDAKFLVPHGYLSDDEGVDADDDAALERNEPLEMKKLRQRLSLAEYEAAHRRGLQKLRPLLLGPIWSSNPLSGLEQTSTDALDVSSTELNDSLEGNKENVADDSKTVGTSVICAVSSSTMISRAEHKLMRSALNAYRVFLWAEKAPISLRINVDPSATPSSRSNGRSKNKFPDEAIPHLIHLIHKNPLGKDKLQFEFRVFWQFHSTGRMPNCTNFAEYKRFVRDDKPKESSDRQSLSLIDLESLSLLKSCVIAKIGQLAVFEDGRWAVRPEILCQYNDELSKICTFPTQDSTAASDQSAIDTELCLPAWNYVTDVSFSKRVGSFRKQLCEISANPADVPQHNRIPVAGASSPVANASSLRDKTAPKLKITPVAELHASPSALCEKTAKLAESLPSSKLDFSHMSSSPALRKRVTLDTFFASPSAKRAKPTDGDLTAPGSSINPICLD